MPMTEQQRKSWWAIFACAATIVLIALIAIQQSWVKRRAIETAPQQPQSSLVFPSAVSDTFACQIGSA
jgi:hypothetical protein